MAGCRRRAARTRVSSSFGPGAGRGRDRGVEVVRQGGDARRPGCRRRRRCRSRGRRASSRRTVSRRGKGVVVCRTQEELDAGLASLSRLRRPARDRGAARGPGGVALRALRRSPRGRRSLRPGTTSVRTTATRAPTPAAWAPTRRPRARRRRASRSCVEQVHRPVLAELRGRGTPFVGPALRRADADRGRAEGARVQLPLRRSRDAGGAAARRRRPARGARRGRAGDLAGVSLGRAHGAAVTVVVAGGRLSRVGRPRLADRRARRRPRRRARSSSMPVPRCTAAASSRTAAACSPSRAGATSRPPGTAYARPSRSRSPARATGPTSRWRLSPGDRDGPDRRSGRGRGTPNPPPTFYSNLTTATCLARSVPDVCQVVHRAVRRHL